MANNESTHSMNYHRILSFKQNITVSTLRQQILQSCDIQSNAAITINLITKGQTWTTTTLNTLDQNAKIYDTNISNQSELVICWGDDLSVLNTYCNKKDEFVEVHIVLPKNSGYESLTLHCNPLDNIDNIETNINTILQRSHVKLKSNIILYGPKGQLLEDKTKPLKHLQYVSIMSTLLETLYI